MPHHLLRVVLLTFVGGLFRIAEGQKCDLAKWPTLRVVFVIEIDDLGFIERDATVGLSWDRTDGSTSC